MSPSICWLFVTAEASASVCHSKSVCLALPFFAFDRNGVSVGLMLLMMSLRSSRTPMASCRVNEVLRMVILGYSEAICFLCVD